MFSFLKRKGPKCARKSRKSFNDHDYEMIAYKQVIVEDNGEETVLVLTFNECVDCGMRDNFVLNGNGNFSGHVGSYSSSNGKFAEELLLWREAGVLSDTVTCIKEKHAEYIAKLLASELTEGG